MTARRSEHNSLHGRWRPCRVARPALLAVGLAVLLAVAGAPASAQDPPPLARPLPEEIPEDPFAGLAERFERLAQRDEAGKDWHQALMRWEAVLAMDTQNRKARSRIVAIRRLLGKEADKHFARAKAALQKEQYGTAFREFLRTLSYDPERHLALAMVKHDLNARSVNPYQVKPGDTSRKIAEATYDDADLAYLVRYFNGIRSDRQLKVGQTLQLPVVAGVNVAVGKPRRALPARPPQQVARQERSKPSAKRKASAPPPPTVAKREATTPAPTAEPQAPALAIVAKEVQQSAPEDTAFNSDTSEARLAEAQEKFDAGKYEAAALAAEAVLDEDPANGGARKLVNAAYYEEGKRLQASNNPVAAMQMFSRLDDSYQDVRKRRTALTGSLSDQQAEVHYIAGVTAFLNENLDQAIQEWELTLKIDPKHPQATKDLENARALRARLAQVQ